MATAWVALLADIPARVQERVQRLAGSRNQGSAGNGNPSRSSSVLLGLPEGAKLCPDASHSPWGYLG